MKAQNDRILLELAAIKKRKTVRNANGSPTRTKCLQHGKQIVLPLGIVNQLRNANLSLTQTTIRVKLGLPVHKSGRSLTQTKNQPRRPTFTTQTRGKVYIKTLTTTDLWWVCVGKSKNSNFWILKITCNKKHSKSGSQTSLVRYGPGSRKTFGHRCDTENRT